MTTETITADDFEQLTGQAPKQDDLERVNCDEAGNAGHHQCGLCEQCGYPRFIPKFDNDVLVCAHN